MKRNLKLFCIGTLPLWVGIVLNAFIPLFPIPIFLFSIVYVLLWTYLCYRCCDRKASALSQGLFLCLFGLVMLSLVILQKLTGGYWVSYLGLMTQLYFLPALSLSAGILRPFLEELTSFPAYVLEMAILALGCFGGCLLKVKRKK